MPENEIITKPYSPTMWDNIVYGLHTYYGSMLRFPGFIFNTLVVFILPLSFNGDALIRGNYLNYAVWQSLALFVWLLVIPLVSLPITWLALKKSTTAFSLRTVHLTSDHLTITGPAFDSKLTWKTFNRAEENRWLILLFLTGNVGHMVSKSAFASPEDAARFLSLAKQHIANAKHKQVGAFYEKETSAIPAALAESQPADTIVSESFHLTFGAFMAYYMVVTYRAFLHPIFLLFITAGTLTPIAYSERFALIDGEWGVVFDQIFIPTILVVLALYLLVFPLSSLVSWQLSKRHPSTKGARTVSLNSTGIAATGTGFEVKVGWGTLTRIRKRFGLILFYHARTRAVLLPVSAFPNKAAADAFYAQALAYFKAAKHPAAKSTLDGPA